MSFTLLAGISLVLLYSAAGSQLYAQKANGLWHGKERDVHYKPDGQDFLLVNGSRRFNRALYGGNSGFRAEAGDIPEFALYLPGMGGNLKFGLIAGDSSKWIIDTKKIETRYRPGSMIYKIYDALLKNGWLTISALATYDREALIIKIESTNVPSNVKLVAAYGGATGNRFSRDGDVGADPESSFNLKPEYCRGNIYNITKNAFTLYYGSKTLSEEERYEIQYKVVGEASILPSTLKTISGIFPPSAVFKISDAAKQASPLQLISSNDSASPAITTTINIGAEPLYFFIQNGSVEKPIVYNTLPQLFNKTEASRKELAGRIKITTPDSFINTLGGALSVAADAVWESPSFLHGAVAWRMRLPGWRGAYLADNLGWHERARTHFSSYARSQVTTPLTGPIEMDTALHLARHAEKMGTSVFSSGYISRNPGGDQRPHHYDMNLVFIDQLLNHFLWTGDTAYVKQMWPLLKRHLDWEIRNFDVDGDNLYDAYAAIWASDALQYSGGGVTHSSAYNFKAFKTAGDLAKIIGEDGEPYQKKAAAILHAINAKLWMPDKGVYAEYKDLLGKQLLHPCPGLWTIYHAIDSKVPDAFQAWQSLRWIDNNIPRIPIRAKGLSDTTLNTVSTTNWQPYTWSLNNVVLGEVMHTALAYWQGGRSEEAFQLWKGSLVESMYLGASPGNFQQLSFYDAVRGELYRDFADDIGMTARSLVEGLFGVFIDALHDTLHITPGFPAGWKHALLSTPDFSYSFQQAGNRDSHTIRTSFSKALCLSLLVKARMDDVESVLINGKKTSWGFDTTAVGGPRLQLKASGAKTYRIEIRWKGYPFEKPLIRNEKGTVMAMSFKKAGIGKLFDPQGAARESKLTPKSFTVAARGVDETKTVFLQVTQGKALYWLPVSVQFFFPSVFANEKANKLYGTFDKVDLSAYFNDEVGNIFKNKYLSPRPKVPTLQLPMQGIGNWAYPFVQPNISDSGLRQRAGVKNEFTTQFGVPFSTPSQYGAKNILYTSQWDNYPDSAIVPLTGKASHAYLLMAGSTNPMQSRMVNGEVVVQYKDGSEDILELKNPENWWPIEQDYYEDGFAFTTDAPKPVRVYFKTGEDTRSFTAYTSIKGFSFRAIDGGAGTVLDLPLNAAKELKSITLKAIANDVVIGLMSITLVR
ncbi:MAG TPA: DUF4450 domain-containing protein [Flavisolibacter sp.]|nr:DUF4450 domain-containing protein [Flavisolibacter sp.]